MFADDMAAGADSLEELFEIYKALVIALDKAGIQGRVRRGGNHLPQLQSNRRRWPASEHHYP